MKEPGGLGVYFTREIKNKVAAAAVAAGVSHDEAQLVLASIGVAGDSINFFRSEIADGLKAMGGAVDENFLNRCRRSFGISSPSAEPAKDESPWRVLETPLLKSPSR